MLVLDANDADDVAAGAVDQPPRGIAHKACTWLDDLGEGPGIHRARRSEFRGRIQVIDGPIIIEAVNRQPCARVRERCVLMDHALVMVREDPAAKESEYGNLLTWVSRPLGRIFGNRPSRRR